MDYDNIINGLEINKAVFQALLQNVGKNEYLWKPAEDKWCMLEIICHLYDEEREDFRKRLKLVLETPELAPPAIDPANWVKSRNYLQQDFSLKLAAFIQEREHSVSWLRSLVNPGWDNASNHPPAGRRTAGMYLANWLAHDYHHIRQINRLKYDYLKAVSGGDLSYAGKW